MRNDAGLVGGILTGRFAERINPAPEAPEGQ